MSNPQLYQSENQNPSDVTVLLIDDAIFSCGSSAFLTECFVKYRSRWNLNIILISQVLFQSELKSLRTVSRNATGLILMRNRRGRQSLKCLAKQLGVDDTKHFMQIFEDATESFGYLFCDMGGWLESETLRYRSGLLPGEISTCYEIPGSFKQ